MIDDDGYRPNVGIVICNRQGGDVGPALWSALVAVPARALIGESAEQAMYRELFEEVGLSRKDVRIGLNP